MLENITFPDPVIFISIEPKTTADQSRMGEALRKLSEEDPTFRFARTRIPDRPLSPGWVNFTGCDCGPHAT